MHAPATARKPIDLNSFDPNAGPIGTPAPPEQIDQWVEQFHRDGYLVLRDVIPPELIQPMKDDLDRALNRPPQANAVAELEYRMFEKSKANLALFELEPVVTFAEKLLKYDVHVVHNNSFRTPTGGGIAGWHQDDPPMYLVTEGEPPKNVRLPVMLFTANYYLTDVEEAKYGTTEVIPGSHLFGASPPVKMEGTKWESKIVPCVGRAGTVVLFNNQVWHRGGPNQTDRVRYITQVSYARRIIGHRYFPFMNYQMPPHVFEGVEKKNPRKRRLLGFLPAGPYG
jgi:ectoine hydroxylase-related dioxygenase (phytanoyl-CoA dioxygenase family)